MKDSSERVTDQRSYRPENTEILTHRRIRAGGLLASLALTSVLVGCAPHESVRLPERNAPASAPYSRDANPQFYDNVADARRYVPGEDLPALEELARQPVAEWLPTDATLAATQIRDALKLSESDGTVPIFVAYAIPNRDLGGHSSGGTAAEEYGTYVRTVSRAIADRDAILVVEPDAVAQIPEMSESQRGERIGLLAEALDTFNENGHTAVYLDAGNSNWRSPDETARLLHDVARESRAGLTGIALNVSNYRPTQETRDYAEKVMSSYGSPLYVLTDTSRNGGEDGDTAGEWCNPADQKLGVSDPDFNASAQFEDAYVKTPGESDGVCGVSDRPAGEFDGDLLIRQLRG